MTGFIHCANGDAGGWSSEIIDSTVGNYIVPDSVVSGLTGKCIINIGVDISTRGLADPAVHATSFIRGHQCRSLAIATVE